MPDATSKLTRSQAVERVHELLLKHCPEHAVEIFVAIGEMQRATLEEFQAGMMEKLFGQVAS